MNPDQTAPKSSPIWVHVVCNTGYQITSADEKVDFCFELWERG